MTSLTTLTTTHDEARAKLRMARVVTWLLVGAICAVGGWSKIRSLSTVATHVDDVGVAVVILEAKRYSTEATVRAQLVKRGGGGPLSAVMRRLDAAGQLGLAVRAVPYVIVPVSFTYAPVQFFFTASLLHNGLSYRDVIWRGRVPSAVAGTLAALLAALVGFRIRGAGAGVRAVVAAAVVACSWELLLLSSQMHNYATGVAGALLLLLLLLSTTGYPRLRAAVAEGVALAVLPWFQYQILFLLPPYLLARSWRMLGVTKSKPRVAAALTLIAAPALVSSVLLYHYFLGRHAVEGVHWNAGAHGEFGFAFAPGLSVLAKAGYTLRFFATNSIESLRAVLSFVPESSGLFRPAAVLLLGLAGIGAFSLSSDRSARARPITVFLLATSGVWAVLVVLGNLTLSPTRHSVILLPFAALLIGEGARAIGNWTRRPQLLGATIVLFVLTSFLTTLAPEITARKDPFDEEAVHALIAQTKPDLVVSYRCSWNLRVMRALGAPLFDSGCIAGPNARWAAPAPTDEPTRILFLSTGIPLDSTEFQLQRRVLNASLPSPWLTREWNDYRATTVAEVVPQRTIEFSARIARGADSLQTALLNYGGLRATLLEATGRAPARP